MQRIICFILLIINSGLHAQKNSAKPKINSDAQQLSLLNAQFIQNFLHNDTVAHNKIIYKDFVCIVASGSVVNRNDYMKGWAHGYDPAVYKSFSMQNELIRVFGNTALVRAETFYTLVVDGKEVNGSTIYTDTYLKLNGRWWCVQVQLTLKK